MSLTTANRYNSAAMALSEQDKQRIREEEAFRLTVRDEFRRQDPYARLKIAVFWILLVLVTSLLYTVVRHGHI
jgi:hypothetical protein